MLECNDICIILLLSVMSLCILIVVLILILLDCYFCRVVVAFSQQCINNLSFKSKARIWGW